MIETTERLACKIDDDCSTTGRPNRGLCVKHYHRWQTHGDPLIVLHGGGGAPRGEAHPRWSGDAPSYNGMHQRLERERGKASEYDCVTCDGPAFQWSYDGLDPDELVEPGGARYSPNPDHYRPMCVRCHNQHEHSGKKNPRVKPKVEEIKALAYFGIKRSRLAEMYNTSETNIGRIVRVERWKPEPVCTMQNTTTESS